MDRSGRRMLLAAVLGGIVGGCVGGFVAGPAWAGGQDVPDVHDVEDRLRRLEERLEAQERKLEAQLEQIQEQKAQIQVQRERLERVDSAQAPTEFTVTWKDGLRFETNDGSFALRIGGRIQNDWFALTTEDGVEDAIGESLDTSGVRFRRARLYLSGTIYKSIVFKMQYDFAGGEADFKDVYIGMKKIRYVGLLRVGQFKEPFSLEELTSSNYITFMERATPNAFAPARSTGIMLANHVLDDRMTWAAGVFRDSDIFGDRTGDAEFNFTGRVTGLPWVQDDAHLLHVGTAYSWRNPNDDEVRFRSRPEVGHGPRFVDTGMIPTDDYQIVGVEGALVHGPASLQAEYMHAAVNADAGGNPGFDSWYVYGSYFLTAGDHRRYDATSGAFAEVTPVRPFMWGDDAGLGAWEIGVRYAQIDLDDAGIDGRTLDDLTVGLNWYLNTNVRVMFNYVFADLDDAGDTHIGAMRFQLFL